MAVRAKKPKPAPEAGVYLSLLKHESPRGHVLISMGLLEDKLKQVLLAFMAQGGNSKSLVDGPNAPLGTLSSRIAACYALSLITKCEHDNLTLMRRIRNDFAHDMETSFRTQSVKDRTDGLDITDADLMAMNATNREDMPRNKVFVVAAVVLLAKLINRADQIERRPVFESLGVVSKSAPLKIVKQQGKIR
jgi:DNA-binding MltR family transcriptional regulator